VGNRLLAEYRPQEEAGERYFYYMSDQVNSTRVVTDEDGNEVYAAAYGPFGELQKTWENDVIPNLKYSGKEREEQTGLDYFGARYYDHTSYRFISPDPVRNRDEAIGNPQLWNLYAFCRNNPVTYLDPDGREVQIMDEVSFRNVRNSIQDRTARSSIDKDPKGFIKKNLINSIQSKNSNFNALKRLVNSDMLIQIHASNDVTYYNNGSNQKQYLPLNENWSGMTVFPNSSDAPCVNMSNIISIYVSTDVSVSEAARTLAHELYGHAFLYTLGLPYIHDHRFVNIYTNHIDLMEY